MSTHKTKGGVEGHAVGRVKKQYDSRLSDKDIRRVLRKAMKEEGVKNGQFVLKEELVRNLKIKVPNGNNVIIVVENGIVITVIDNPLNTHTFTPHSVPAYA